MHSPIQLGTSGEAPDASRPPLRMPAISAATEIGWSVAESKDRRIYGFDSLDPRSRSFNLIRAKLLEMKAQRSWRLIGVVSATPNVGKSFISANVAAALSRDPSHVTLVADFDLRRASLSKRFAIEPEHGLRAYLREPNPTVLPTVYRLEDERLLIMPTSAGPIQSAELLAGENAQALLRSMRVSEENRMFIIDLPPVFANDDAFQIMARLDSYILVAEEGKTKQREVRDVVGLLGSERMAGVILNKYRGGVISEGYGADSYYASGYDVAARQKD